MARILVLIVTLLIPAAASAGIDYVCLPQCKARGTDSATCMKECTVYETKPAAPAGEALEAGSARNKQFDAPVKSPGIVIAPKETPAPVLDTDYVCLQDCLQQKLQYSLCQSRCQKAKETTPAGR